MVPVGLTLKVGVWVEVWVIVRVTEGLAVGVAVGLDGLGRALGPGRG